MATIKIKQIRSRIGSPKDQKRTLDALGLRKINQIVEHEETPSILGMVNKVKHLVSIIEDASVKYTNRKIEKNANKTICPTLNEFNLYDMKEYKVLNLTIYKNAYFAELEDKYRNELSKLLLDTFGVPPYSTHDIVRSAITFSYNYFCDKFIELCHSEKSVRFYQLILSQHEQATEVAVLASDSDYPAELNRGYIALYRRVLKWILEQACDIKLHNNEKTSLEFLKRAKVILNELMFLGDMIFTCANIYAEQDMIEDVAEILFDEENHYVINHKHHYNYIIQDINRKFKNQSYKHVVDESALPDLYNAIENCFGVKYAMLTTVIQEIHRENAPKGGQYCGFGWESLPLSVESMFNVDYKQAKVLFEGLTLHRDNKLKLHDLACKPHTMYRYLYRPILIWNIEGEDFAIIGINGFKDSVIQLATNCIPWGKAPNEWLQNKSFKEYVHLKEDAHDKWLDDAVEDKVKKEMLPYYRNITSLHTANGPLNFDIKGVGEIDFIIIVHDQNKIYVADCKHLQGRYDMMSQRNDFSNFRKKKGYDEQIQRKVDFIKIHLEELNYHNKQVFGKEQPEITGYGVEGIFIINTPTFYMFNSDYRIYIVDDIIDVLSQRYVDPEYTIMTENEMILNVKYPYFQRPSYLLIDSLNTDDEEANK